MKWYWCVLERDGGQASKFNFLRIAFILIFSVSLFWEANLPKLSQMIFIHILTEYYHKVNWLVRIETISLVDHRKILMYTHKSKEMLTQK